MNFRELFQFNHNGRMIGMAIQGSRGRRIYLGFINGDLAAHGYAKGDLLRDLVQIARHYPKALPGQRAIVARLLTAN